MVGDCLHNHGIRYRTATLNGLPDVWSILRGSYGSFQEYGDPNIDSTIFLSFIWGSPKRRSAARIPKLGVSRYRTLRGKYRKAVGPIALAYPKTASLEQRSKSSRSHSKTRPAPISQLTLNPT